LNQQQTQVYGIIEKNSKYLLAWIKFLPLMKHSWICDERFDFWKNQWRRRLVKNGVSRSSEPDKFHSKTDYVLKSVYFDWNYAKITNLLIFIDEEFFGMSSYRFIFMKNRKHMFWTFKRTIERPFTTICSIFRGKKSCPKKKKNALFFSGSSTPKRRFDSIVLSC